MFRRAARLVQASSALSARVSARVGARVGARLGARVGARVSELLQRTEPPPAALLGPDEPRTLSAGPFAVTWRAGVLAIHHASSPGRALWASCAGEAFLELAFADLQIGEARGFFDVRERILARSGRQTIERMDADGAAAVLEGRLEGAAPAVWQLRFEAVDDDQLRFSVRFEGGPYLARVQLTFRADPAERIFGCGAQLTHLDLKGRRVPVISQESGIGRGVEPLTTVMDAAFGAGGAWHNAYAPAAHFISSRLASLSLENTEYSVLDFRDPVRTRVAAFAQRLEGRILHGRTPLELIEVHTRYAGRMPPLPDWVHRGAIVGAQGGTRAIEHLSERLERHRVPVAAFWLQDWVGGRTTSAGRQLWWNWEIDRDTYPDWEPFVAQLRARGIRVLSYVNPFLVDVREKPRVGRDLCAEAHARGFLVKDRDGRPYPIANTSFFAHLVDLTHPEARAWLKAIIRDQVLGAGVSGWMADFGEALPFDAVLADGSDPARAHNRYPVEWAGLNREVIREAGAEGEVFFFSRSGFTASPGVAMLFWLGDQLASWRREDGIKSAVVGLLSGGFSGLSLNHGDAGGYIATTVPARSNGHAAHPGAGAARTGRRAPERGLSWRRAPIPGITFARSKELLQRWVELSAFTAVLRTHEGNQPDRHHQIDADDETLAHFARFARVYAALADYRRALVAEASRSGTPVVRHLWLQFPEDPSALAVEFTFMLGPDLLVAPVLEPGAEAVVSYLPAAPWVHLWTGEAVGSAAAGGWYEVQAPIGAPAVFYRSGAPAGADLADRLKAAGDRRVRPLPRPVARPVPPPRARGPG